MSRTSRTPIPVIALRVPRAGNAGQTTTGIVQYASIDEGTCMSRQAVILAFAGSVAMLSAQAPEPSGPAFEVASVKPAGPAVPIGRLPPNQWRVGRLNLVQLIARAHPRFAFDGLVVGGPAWVREARFDIEARMDPATTPAQLARMISKLLADRFALRTHTEGRPVDVYVLKMSRDDGQLGTQLTRSDPSCIEARTTRQPFPPHCRETATSGMQSRVMQISDFLGLMSVMGIDRPVLDRTGLSGHFDLELQYDYAPFSGAFGGPQSKIEGVSLFTALRDQAGLKLDAAREVVDVLVIDSVERPTPD
jgi:uncharacterized protein (TIGR03435 family)